MFFLKPISSGYDRLVVDVCGFVCISVVSKQCLAINNIFFSNSLSYVDVMRFYMSRHVHWFVGLSVGNAVAHQTR